MVVNNLAFNDLLARALPPTSRNALVYLQSGIAGAVAIGAAWLAHHLSTDDPPIRQHLNLLWVGADVTALAGLAIGLIWEGPGHGEHRRIAEHGHHPGAYVAELRAGLRRVGEVPWFRKYIVARCLLVSAELAMPFYAIHGATLHADKPAASGRSSRRPASRQWSGGRSGVGWGRGRKARS